MPTPLFYPSKISVSAGETVSIAASGSSSPCSLEISRIGARAELVSTLENIAVESHPAPKDADANGCNWPEVAQFEVENDWPTGYYDLKLIDAAGENSHHFICVRKAASVKKSKAVIVLTTNTYAAYNYWGGANSYAHVEKLQSGELEGDAARAAAIGRLSWRRPLVQAMFATAPDAPRLINDTPREFQARPVPQGLDWLLKHRPSAYDGSAGFVNKWEHKFAAWAETQGYSFDYITDYDFEQSEDVLAGYECALLVGHSEYWSANGRRQVDQFVQNGGHLAVFSGNTCYWKVRWEDSGNTMIAHKWEGENNDPLWRDPATRSEATHLWSHPEFANPEASTFGLSFLYGGYHRLAMCVARGAAAYTVYDDQHWALADTDLFYGDQLGTNVPLIGYENDGCPITFNQQGLPVAAGGVGVPKNLQIIALAPATLAEPANSPYPSAIPPERPEFLAKCAFGETGNDTEQRLMRGHAVMASFKHGAGEVFNAGTTEWAHGLAAADPYVETVTKNVLRRFGAI